MGSFFSIPTLTPGVVFAVILLALRSLQKPSKDKDAPKQQPLGLEGLVNVVSLVGWCGVLVNTVQRFTSGSFPGLSVWEGSELAQATLGLELVCVSDVVRMLTGSLRGNWVLGVPLHYTRLFVLLTVLPALQNAGNVGELILLAWSLTEVCRYPMYLLTAAWTKHLRNAVPILTFPLGSGYEAYACYLFACQTTGLLSYLASLQVFINVVLGATLVYPGVVKRGLAFTKPARKPAPPAAGTLFPSDGKGGRKSTPFGKAIISKALGAAKDAEGCKKCAGERVWRFKYNQHFMRLVRSSLVTPEASLAAAKAGIEFFYSTFEFASPSDPSKIVSFADNLRDNQGTFETGVVRGEATRATQAYGVPYNGGWHPAASKAPSAEKDVLTGDALKQQLSKWVDGGVIEADAAAGVAWTADYFAKGKDLSDTYFVMIGAGSAMGPFPKLLALGGNVVALDIPGKWGKGSKRPASGLWERLIGTARRSPGGSITFPLSKPQKACASDMDLYEAAGCNLMEQPAEVANWLEAWQKTIPAKARVVIGNYTYLNGENHVKLSLCADACIERLRKVRPSTAVAFLCTPTDIHVVPREAAEAAKTAYGSGLGPLGLEKLVNVVTLGKKLVSNVLPPVKSKEHGDIFLVDGMSVAQGPNYALAKRLQHWRAQVAFSEGATVSTSVAPSTATISVIQNKTFGWAYGGMPYFGYEIFKQDTTNAVMAALLIHDVLNDLSPKNPANAKKLGVTNSLELFKSQGVHGGLWRSPYKLDTIGEVSVAIYFGLFGRKVM